MEIKHGRGCVYAIEYYIVWCVKYRHKVLKDEVAEFLKEVLTETAYGFRVESLEVVEDHVDVLVSATPQHTIPNIVKMLKGISARKLFLKFPQLKKSYGEDTFGTHRILLVQSLRTQNTGKRYIEDQNVKSSESI